MRLKATVFDLQTGQTTWFQLIPLFVIASAVAVYSILDGSEDTADTLNYIKQASTILNSLVIFLLGFHTAGELLIHTRSTTLVRSARGCVWYPVSGRKGSDSAL